MKNRKKWIIIGVIALVVIAVGAIGATRMDFSFGQSKKETEEKQEIVRRGEFLVRVRESGNLRSFLEVDVRSNVEGEIVEIFIDEGDKVEIGDPLLRIDDEQILEQRKQAAANRDARKAQLQQAELQIQITEKQQESSLAQAHNSVAVAQATLDSFVATTQQRLTEAETQVATTQIDLNRDQIGLKQAEIALSQANLMLDRAKTSVGSAKVALNTAESEYNRNQELFNKKLVSKRTLEESQNQLAGATSQYENAQKEVESQEETIKSQEENINVRKEAISSRESTLELNKKNVLTLKESEEARKKQLEAELENARTRLRQLEETTEEEKELTRHAKVGAAASLLQAQSQLESQQERYEWTTVIAPIAGTVTRLTVEEGEIITSGRSAFSRGDAIMRIADLDQMIVRTQINQVEIGKIKEDQRAEISVDSYPGQVFPGRVSEISPSATPRGTQNQSSVITFEVDVEVIGSPPELLPGMSADVDIIVFEESDILQLPIPAVLSPKVFTVKAKVNPTDLGQFQENQTLKIRNLIGNEFDGRIGEIAPEATRGNLEILLEGSQKGLKNGPTEISIVISEQNVLSDIEAEVSSERQYFVMLDTGESNKDNKEPKGVKTHITIGQRNNTHFQITGGLKEGDRVFVPSMQELTKGQEDPLEEEEDK
ncbi:MAG: HlyD family efflux transporter periplasmic adaptor subunit [Candidatus Poribacteria bacterium]|nr:HlyD family efflux transporter periplasmic adaptor subunit [Candidatus Poribacteria bacterium]